MKNANQEELDELSQEEVNKIEGGGEDTPIPSQVQEVLNALKYLRMR